LNTQTYVKLAVNSRFGGGLQVVADTIQTQDVHTVSFNSSGIAAGIYLFSLTTLEERELRMMLRVK